MTSLHRQPAYARTSGAVQAQALPAAVAASRPRGLLVHKLSGMCPVLRGGGELPAVVLDLDDVEHKAFARQLDLPPHWGAKRLLRGWLPALRHGERRALVAARMAFVCSDADRDDLAARLRLHNIAVVPNAVQEVQPSPVPASKTALFLGLHSYLPNRNAAELLVHDIWPLIRARHADATLLVAGKASELVRGHDHPPPGVRFEGFVSDLQQLYASTRVVCCPIQSGGGTRIKIIEGAMQARPIVSTTLGTEGLDFSPARGEIAIADSPAAFAEAVSKLFDDHAAAVGMGQAARLQATALYSEARVLQRVVALLNQAFGN